MNKNDPLLKTEDKHRQLFDKFTKEANGYTADSVVDAAVNLLINCLRQAHPSQRGALDSLEQVTAKARQILAEHYDGVGKRRNIFPYTQALNVGHFNAKETWL